jgi:hypothetical protein
MEALLVSIGPQSVQHERLAQRKALGGHCPRVGGTKAVRGDSPAIRERFVFVAEQDDGVAEQDPCRLRGLGSCHGLWDLTGDRSPGLAGPVALVRGVWFPVGGCSGGLRRRG